MHPLVGTAALRPLTLAILALVPLQEDPSAKIHAILQKRFAEGGPGAAVAVLQEGKLIQTAVRGFSHVDKRAPITVDSVFDLASCSKQFTAMAVMILAERGKLAFEDDVRKVLPELPEYDPKRPIRIVDLLQMTAGFEEILDLLKDPVSATLEDALKAVAARPLRFPTGSKYEYSNTAYNLLALIVKRVSGRTYGDFLADAIFTPLGMKDTAVLEGAKWVIRHRATGYAKRKQGWAIDVYDTPGLVGDGGVFSSVTDLARWDRALREGKLVSPKTLQLAFTRGTLDSGARFRYGFGWMMAKGETGPLVFHRGAWSGTSTYILRNLKSGVSVIVLSNLAQSPVDEIAAEIAALFE